MGINTGDGETFISHEYSLTPQVINITSSRVPADRVMVDGMLVYRVDGQNRTRSCVDSSDGRLWVSAVDYVRPINRSLKLFEYYLPITAELILIPRLGNQLGGTPVLIQGLCLEPGFIQCTFDGRSSQGRFVDEGTALCTTPIMSTQGTVEVRLTNARRGSRPVTASATFTTGK